MTFCFTSTSDRYNKLLQCLGNYRKQFGAMKLHSIQHYVIKLSVTCGRLVVFPGTPVSSTNKTDRHDITEVALNTINKPTNQFQRSDERDTCAINTNQTQCRFINYQLIFAMITWHLKIRSKYSLMVSESLIFGP